MVITKTNDQFLKWFDFNNIIHDTDDDYRLGYETFSRARELLCITTLEKPNEKLIKKLEELNIKVI